MEQKQFLKNERTAFIWVNVGCLILFIGLMIWKYCPALHTLSNACVFHEIFHLYCPGCGGTRAFYYFVHGNVWQSLIHNPFVSYTLVLYSVFMINTFLCRHTKKVGFVGFPITILIYVAIGILFGQWIVRNVIWIVFKITLL